MYYLSTKGADIIKSFELPVPLFHFFYWDFYLGNLGNKNISQNGINLSIENIKLL